MTLTEFLLARIAEDEEAAQKVIESNVHLFALLEADGDATTGYRLEEANQGSEYLVGARPSRVLAECDAKRRIVELAEGPINDLTWIAVGAETTDSGDTDVDQKVLRLLALPYADHPDYDPSWRP